MKEFKYYSLAAISLLLTLYYIINWNNKDKKCNQWDDKLIHNFNANFSIIDSLSNMIQKENYTTEIALDWYRIDYDSWHSEIDLKKTDEARINEYRSLMKAANIYKISYSVLDIAVTFEVDLSHCLSETYVGYKLFQGSSCLMAQDLGVFYLEARTPSEGCIKVGPNWYAYVNRWRILK